MIFFSILLTSILGAQLTYFLIHRRHFSTVRASSGATLIFALLMVLWDASNSLIWQTAFFGSTFVGMTDAARLGWRRVLIASFAFALIFFFLLHYTEGYGGGLGAAAFISSGFVYYLSQLVRT